MLKKDILVTGKRKASRFSLDGSCERGIFWSASPSLFPWMSFRYPAPVVFPGSGVLSAFQSQHHRQCDQFVSWSSFGFQQSLQSTRSKLQQWSPFSSQKIYWSNSNLRTSLNKIEKDNSFTAKNQATDFDRNKAKSGSKKNQQIAGNNFFPKKLPRLRAV